MLIKRKCLLIIQYIFKKAQYMIHDKHSPESQTLVKEVRQGNFC